MSKPPSGVDDIFAAVMGLLAKVDPNIPVTKKGTVKDRSWGAAKKALMGNIAGFLDGLKGFKDRLMQALPDRNWQEVDRILNWNTLTQM